MKMTSLTLFLIFITINLYADKNWIKIEATNKTQTPKSNIKPNLDLSQIQPINKMMKNLTVIKQLIDNNKKEKVATNDKNWFLLNTTRDSK